MCASVTTLMARSPQPSGDRAIKNPRMRRVASISPGPTQKETYYSVKRDLLQCQKRPTTVSKDTHSTVRQASPPPGETCTTPSALLFFAPTRYAKAWSDNVDEFRLLCANESVSVERARITWSVHFQDSSLQDSCHTCTHTKGGVQA